MSELLGKAVLGSLAGDGDLGPDPLLGLGLDPLEPLGGGSLGTRAGALGQLLLPRLGAAGDLGLDLGPGLAARLLDERCGLRRGLLGRLGAGPRRGRLGGLAAFLAGEVELAPQALGLGLDQLLYVGASPAIGLGDRLLGRGRARLGILEPAERLAQGGGGSLALAALGGDRLGAAGLGLGAGLAGTLGEPGLELLLLPLGLLPESLLALGPELRLGLGAGPLDLDPDALARLALERLDLALEPIRRCRLGPGLDLVTLAGELLGALVGSVRCV